MFKRRGKDDHEKHDPKEAIADQNEMWDFPLDQYHFPRLKRFDSQASPSQVNSGKASMKGKLAQKKRFDNPCIILV